jgi:imidazole glycerol-phosphate synthase subunit HisF
MLAKRIIPCLDVKNGEVVKGVRFRSHTVMGDIVSLAKIYSELGADELVFYDITASCEVRTVDCEWIRRVAAVIDIPFCVAGGIRTIRDAENILRAGADKVSINSPALERPQLIDEFAARLGSQCVVVGIDSKREHDEFIVYQYTGDEHRTRCSRRATADWIIEVQQRGVGEIVLNCMDHDGVRDGYDIEQLQSMCQLTQVPLIASGGAGNREHFYELFKAVDVSGALAASVFHNQVVTIPDLKEYLAAHKVVVRQ